MKNIKQIIIAFVCCIVSVAHAQEQVELFTVPLSEPGNKGKLELGQIKGSISVVGYDGNEIIVKATLEERKTRNSDAGKGMKRIANSSLSISAEERNNVVQIINEQHNRKTDLEIKVPKNFDLRLSTVNKGDIIVEGVQGEMEISNVNGEITLKDISGSASADTTNGDIKVVFNSITENTSMAFSSFQGDIDITFPESLKANVKMRSDMGEIFTDFDMAIEDKKLTVETNSNSDTRKISLEQWVKGKINGGGAEMLFKTWQGDIMIRSN
ncbi:DUF4097 family beta strand repeat-containing protein [Spongiimicrobium salis]|uniref:DUF4097 family beta strand repeat-containing protein n=1 Tax=Spongiimicrobium salis TaxID=1667022 RepID=UPI00374D00B5